MSRPQCQRNIEKISTVSYFKPSGVPKKLLQTIILNQDEFEALRLKHIENLEQLDCAKQLGVSQPTFHRILSSAHKKVAQALVLGNVLQFDITKDKP